MIKLSRPPAPKVLNCYKELGRAFAERRMANPKVAFSWGKTRYCALIRALEAISHNHCAFCDGFPLGETSQQTIEHFRPKHQYPKLAYAWPNLFLCCNECQSAKGQAFDRMLLKPDQPRYQFERYFIVHYRSGRLEPNPHATPHDQQRATTTIRMYDLNSSVRCASRLRWARGFRAIDHLHPDERPYRFL